MEERAERLSKPVEQGVCPKVVSPRHIREATPVKSYQHGGLNMSRRTATDIDKT